MSDADRLLSKIDAAGDCWDWTASLNHRGYGKFWIGRHCVQAHRAVWELLVGELDPTLLLDHRCRRRSCVNPDHLEPVTHRENTRRGFSPVGRKMRAAA